jgi:hypothetical protein
MREYPDGMALKLISARLIAGHIKVGDLKRNKENPKYVPMYR